MAMRIEFIPAGAEDCPLILIVGDVPDQVRELAGALTQVAHGPVELTRLPWVEPVGGLEVVAVLAARSREVRRLHGQRFEWRLDQADWEDVQELLAPFTRPIPGNRFQYLHQSETRVIVSTDGHW